MSEGWMWSSTLLPGEAIRQGAQQYVFRQCRFPSWVRASAMTLGDNPPALVDSVRVIVDSSIPPQHFLFGVNGGQDVVQFGS